MKKNSPIRMVSWNVNGIRAWHKKGLLDWFRAEKPDFFFVQETKADPIQLVDELKVHEGYVSYFNHSKVKKGYSGVACYTRFEPTSVEYGLKKGVSDEEGRFVAMFYDKSPQKVAIINCYFPNGGGGPVRLEYKLNFYNDFLKYIESLKKRGYSVIFCGDINTAHNEIDLARPKENVENTGFLPIERAWMDKVISKGYVDTFRSLNVDKVKYSYWDMKTFARERNVGWRIDYFFVSEDLKKNVLDADIHTDIAGSDHCPISIKIDLSL